MSVPASQMPPMQPVESSNIDSIGYTAELGLFIKFKGGGLYQYTGPTAEKNYNDLLAADSKGRHFTKHIRHDPQLVVKRIS